MPIKFLNDSVVPALQVGPSGATYALAVDGPISTDQYIAFLTSGVSSSPDMTIGVTSNVMTFSDVTGGGKAIFNVDNVGIGTTSPGNKLEVNSGETNVTAAFKSNDNQAWVSVQDDDSGTYGALFGTDSDANHAIVLADSSANKRLVVSATTGDVGIGTTTPDTKLDVYGRAVIGTGNTLTNATNATVIGNSNNLTNDSIIDTYTNLVLGDYGAGRYGNTVISDRTLRLGRVDNTSSFSSNTTGILNFNDSVEGNSAFSNVGGLVGYFPPPNTTNDYYFINAFSENVNGSAFATGASPTASRYNMSTSPSLSCIGQKFDANTTNSGAVYITASQNNANASSRGIFTFDARHQNQNYEAPDGHSLFEITSGYGRTKFIVKQVSGSSNVGIGTTNPSRALEINTTGSNDYQFRIGTSSYYYDIGRNTSTGFLNFYGNQSNASGFVFETVNGERMRIDSSGNVGIGTASPQKKLHVSSNDQTTARIRLSNTNTSSGGDNIDLVAGIPNVGQDGFSIHNATSNQTQFVILGTGNVGIGTASPGQKLEVAGNGLFGNGNTPITLQVGEATGYTSQTNSTLKLAQGGGNYHEFRGLRTSDEEGSIYRMQEYTDGTLVRTTQTYDGETTQTLYGDNVNISGSSTNIYNVDYMDIRSYIYHDLDTNTRFGFPGTDTFVIDTSGSERMRINSLGNVGIGTTSPSEKLAVSGGNIEIADNTGGRKIGFNVSDSISFNNTTIAHYGMSNAGNSEAGGITYSGYYGQKFFINGAQRMVIERSGDVGIGTTNPTAKLDVDGSFKLSDFTSTSVATTGSLSPNQNYQASTQDTLADLTVDPSGNVVRGMQEGTWTFTKAQLDGNLGMTLISAPGTNKAVIVYESSWMIKYNATGAISANQRYEIRQASNTGVGIVAVLPGAKINEILSNGQTMPGGGASAYGFYSRDVPADAGGRTFKTNTATTLHKNVSNQLPGGVQTVSIKLRYRIYDATTF